MKKQDVSVESLVDMIERGEVQLPEMQRRYVWRAPRVRDLFDSLYRGYPSGSILVWETNAGIPARELQVHETPTGQEPRKLLLDGQQRLTSLAAVIRGKPINVRGRRRPIDILFILEHPDALEELTGVRATRIRCSRTKTRSTSSWKRRPMRRRICKRSVKSAPSWFPARHSPNFPTGPP